MSGVDNDVDRMLYNDNSWFAIGLIMFSVDYIQNGLTSIFDFEMSENGEKLFLKPKMTSSKVLFCAQPKDIQFTVVKELRNQTTLILEELESENIVAGN